MRLFFYGVLIEALASPIIRQLLAGLGPGQPATVQGDLYAVQAAGGWHPAMVAGSGTVHGVLYEAGRVDLAGLDRFEGADYRRAAVTVTSAQGEIEAQAYLWLRPVAGLERIAHGDFARWLGETGNDPLSG